MAGTKLIRVNYDFGNKNGLFNALLQNSSPNTERGFGYNPSTKAFEFHDGIQARKLVSSKDLATETDLSISPDGVLVRGVAGAAMDQKISAAALSVAAGSANLLQIVNNEISMTGFAFQQTSLDETHPNLAGFIATNYTSLGDLQQGDMVILTKVPKPGVPGEFITEVWIHNGKTTVSSADFTKIETPNLDATGIRALLASGAGLDYNPATGVFSIGNAGITAGMLNTAAGAGQVNAKIIPLDPSGGYQGTATDVQGALDEIGQSIGTLLPLDGSKAMTGNLLMGSNEIHGSGKLTLKGKPDGNAAINVHGGQLGTNIIELTTPDIISIRATNGIFLNGEMMAPIYYKDSPNGLKTVMENMETQPNNVLPHLGYIKDNYARMVTRTVDLLANQAIDVEHGYTLTDGRDVAVTVWDNTSVTDVAITHGTDKIHVTSNEDIMGAKVVMCIYQAAPTPPAT